MSAPMQGNGGRAGYERDLWRGRAQRGDGDGWRGPARQLPEPTSLGAELRQLFQDGAALIRAEVELARLEIREAATRMISDVRRVAIAAGVGVLAVLCLTAFLVIIVGDLLGHRYGLSALLVGVVLGVVAWAMLKSALTDMKRTSLKPEQTAETLQRDKEWAARETAEFRRRISA